MGTVGGETLEYSHGGEGEISEDIGQVPGLHGGSTPVCLLDISDLSPGLAGRGGLQRRPPVLPGEYLLHKHGQSGCSPHGNVHSELLQTSGHIQEDLTKINIQIQVRVTKGTWRQA